MFYLIENQEQLKILQNRGMKEAFVEVISYNDHIHPSLNNISLVYIRPVIDVKGYLISINHSEALSVDITHIDALLQTIDKIYVRNKKQFLYYFALKNVFDISLLGADINVSTNAHDFIYQRYDNRNDVNLLVPIVKHYEKHELIYNKIKPFIGITLPEWYDFYNNKATLAFLYIEKTGIKIDYNLLDSFYNISNPLYSIKDDIIYSQYNLYTTTKRPSNSFNNINFSALNKDNGSRKSFIAKNDYLLDFDISAYHPSLIAKLVDYEFKNDIHTELAEMYGVDYKTSKELTFKQLYGGIFDQYKNIEYFKRIQNYIDKLWLGFNTHGYIETPISKYKFYKYSIDNPNPNKLFNYLLQELETSTNINIIWDVIKILKGKNTKLILYTYDSFTFDFDKNELEVIESIKNIFIKNNLKYKIKQGVNYDF